MQEIKNQETVLDLAILSSMLAESQMTILVLRSLNAKLASDLKKLKEDSGKMKGK